MVRVFDYKRRNGEYIGSFVPYGYLKDPADKHALIVDEEAAEVVRQIFTMFLDGMAKNAIARYFNNTSLICPSLYKKQKGQKYNSPCGDGSALWATCTIDGILKNECGSIGVKLKFSDELRRIAEYVEINTKTAAG